MRRTILNLLALLFSAMAVAGGARAQTPPSLIGTWSGVVEQNKYGGAFSVVMVLSADGGVTDYPQLKCGGSLTRAGSANDYVFFTETITRGGQTTGGDCFDGVITVLPVGDRLVWFWTGALDNEAIVAWSTLTRIQTK